MNAEQEIRRIQWQVGIVCWRHNAEKIEILSILKISPLARIFRARMGGRDVVVKQFTSLKHRRRKVPSTLHAVRNLRSRLSEQKFSANNYILGSRLFGIVVVEFVEGDGLEVCLKKGWDGAFRQRLIRLSAEWTNKAAGSSVTSKPFSREAVSGRIDFYQTVKPDPPYAHDLQRMVQILYSKADELDGVQLLSARGHNDFAPRNLIISSDGILVGIDVHLDRYRFVSDRAANFLVSKDLGRAIGRRPTAFGLDVSEMNYYLRHSNVPPDELNSSFVFFVGLFQMRMLCRRLAGGRGVKSQHMRVRSYLDSVDRGEAVTLEAIPA